MVPWILPAPAVITAKMQLGREDWLSPKHVIGHPNLTLEFR